MRTEMWRPPRRRAYEPKPYAPGSRITWEREVAPGETETRTGEIWSDGPVGSSYWVIPDDAPDPVAVKLPGKRDREWGRGPRQLAEYTANWARDAVRRADNVRARGVYAVVDFESRSALNGMVLQKWYVWHTDPQCPDAEGKERDSNPYPPYGVWDVVDILVGRVHTGGLPPFCARCIYLTNPGVESPGSISA